MIIGQTYSKLTLKTIIGNDSGREAIFQVIRIFLDWLMFSLGILMATDLTNLPLGYQSIIELSDAYLT